MIAQFLELKAEYTAFIESHPQVECLLLSKAEIVVLTQLAHVLKPFKDYTLKVSEDMPSLARSLELYWDLDDLLRQVINGEGKYTDLNAIIRVSFKAREVKYVKYKDKLTKNAIIYAAYILDPCCKTSMIKDMLTDQAETTIEVARKYFKTEWPELATISSSNPSPAASIERPPGVSITHWKSIQNKRAKEAESLASQATSELEQWLHLDAIEWDDKINNGPEFVRLWWKEHAAEWPLLAKAARDLLPCSASEVDVERLFSGCRDEIGIRRHSLRPDTVRVLTLLRSAYCTEDDVDKTLIKEAMKLDLDTLGNSIL